MASPGTVVPSSSVPVHLPTSLSEIDLAWFRSMLMNNPALQHLAPSLTTADNRTEKTGGFFVGGNSSVAIFDLDFGGLAEPMSMCVKLMPEESLVPKWLLKRFWKAEVFFYKRMRGGFPQPECYFAGYESDHAILVMNEMTKSNLDPGDSCRDLTYSEACKSLVILAKFHAKWWGAEDKMLNALGRFNSAESGITCKFLMGGAKNMLAMEEYEPIHNLVRLMEKKVKVIFKYLKRGPYTVTHGDSRSDNFFYRRTEAQIEEVFDEVAYNRIVDDSGRQSETGSQNGSDSGSERHSIESALTEHSEAALCDFQMIMVSNPMRDYANFVVNSLSPADRHKWTDRLIKVYHTELVKCGVDADEYTYDQAKEDARVMMFWPMLCNISIADSNFESSRKFQKMEDEGKELTPKERAKWTLLKKTRPRLISAAKDAGLEEMLEGKARDPPLPFIPCCCCWGC